MSQDFRLILAKKVKFYRERHKLKREELSLLLGYDNSYISKLEKGKMNITIDKIEEIAKYFNITAKNLFE
ncbi:MAG: helix-turn-helix domain-containing protein [bacterium]|nr:helix-turn-helix domain-containing protein [bacterium]